MEFYGQIIGYIALVAGIIAYTEKDDKRCLIYNVVVCLLWATHYLLLGLPAASYILAYDGLKSTLAIKYKKNIILLVILLTGSLFLGWYTYDGSLTSLMPVATSLLWTTGIFLLEGVAMRIVFILVISTWLTYNFYVFSPSAIISNSITLVAAIVGLLRVAYKK